MGNQLKKIHAILEGKNLDAIFVSTPANITSIIGFEFLVETEREAFLLITKNKEYIISSQLYREDLQRLIPSFHFFEFTTAGGKSFWEFINDALIKKKMS